MGEPGVLHVTLPADADGRVEQHDVYAFLVEDLDALGRIPAARRTAFFVTVTAGGQKFGRIHFHAAQAGQTTAHRLQRLAVEEQHFETLRVVIDANGPRPVGGRDVLEPGIAGLEDVAVGVDGEHAVGRRCGHVVLPWRDVRVERSCMSRRRPTVDLRIIVHGRTSPKGGGWPLLDGAGL